MQWQPDGLTTKVVSRSRIPRSASHFSQDMTLGIKDMTLGMTLSEPLPKLPGADAVVAEAITHN